MILPEVKDPKNWKDNRLEFADNDGKYAFVFVNQSGSILGYNTELVKTKAVPKSINGAPASIKGLASTLLTPSPII